MTRGSCRGFSSANHRLYGVLGDMTSVRPASNVTLTGSRRDITWVDANNDGDNGSDLDADDIIGKANPRTGIYALNRTDLFNLLCIPPIIRDTSVSPPAYTATPPNVYEAALALCVERRAMLIIDPDPAWGESIDNAVANAIQGRTTLNPSLPAARNAALYFPCVREVDPLRDNGLEIFVPSGIIAGIMARTDTSRGVWKAPAGLDAALAGVQGLQVNLNDSQNGQLNQLGINCLRSFPANGRVVWGARTLRGADQLADEYKYIPVRRLALFIEESLYRGTQWVVFEPNDEPLWAQIRLNIGAFMQNLFATVTRVNASLAADLVVTLASSDTTEATVPATVTIPAGQASVSFPIAAVDDTIPDGTQAVTITATAGRADRDRRRERHRQRAARPGPDGDDQPDRRAGADRRQRRHRHRHPLRLPLDQALTVTLTSSDTTEATVPATVTIPAGQASATFASPRSTTRSSTAPGGDHHRVGHRARRPTGPITYDTTLGPNGGWVNGWVNGRVAIAPDGKMVVAGTYGTVGSNADFGVYRYNANGTPDATFGSSGTVCNSTRSARPTSRPRSSSSRTARSSSPATAPPRPPRPARWWSSGSGPTAPSTPAFDTDGIVRLTFGSGVFTNVFDAALQPDGKILLAGNIGADFAVVRLNANGTLDTTFDGDGVVRDGPERRGRTAYGVAVAPDGKIVAVGAVAEGSATDQRLVVARYNADGTPDAGFGTGGVVSATVAARPPTTSRPPTWSSSRTGRWSSRPPSGTPPTAAPTSPSCGSTPTARRTPGSPPAGSTPRPRPAPRRSDPGHPPARRPRSSPPGPPARTRPARSAAASSACPRPGCSRTAPTRRGPPRRCSRSRRTPRGTSTSRTTTASSGPSGYVDRYRTVGAAVTGSAGLNVLDNEPFAAVNDSFAATEETPLTVTAANGVRSNDTVTAPLSAPA